jgi:hypothetical protein
LQEEIPNTIMTMRARNKGGQPATSKRAEDTRPNKETDHDEEEAVMEIIRRSTVEKENDIAVENNKLKERIKMLEEHVCIMSTNRSSSNSSGQTNRSWTN